MTIDQPSKASLATKLGVKPGSRLLLLHRPKSLSLDLPMGVSVLTRKKEPDVVVAFFTRVDSLRAEVDELARLIYPSASLWVAWPKKSSGLNTDISDHLVRESALGLGLVDNKVCSIDSTWTALRLVWRVELRVSSAPTRKASK